MGGPNPYSIRLNLANHLVNTPHTTVWARLKIKIKMERDLWKDRLVAHCQRIIPRNTATLWLWERIGVLPDQGQIDLMPRCDSTERSSCQLKLKKYFKRFDLINEKFKLATLSAHGGDRIWLVVSVGTRWSDSDLRVKLRCDRWQYRNC